MTLSVCCLTNDPGPQVEAALAQLRPLAGEIVVAADARADDERLAHYAAVADKLLRIEYAWSERHLAWLHAQCSGDWILRIDGDEVASPALLAALPELTAGHEVEQYWLPRRWLYPDAGHWLDGPPWWPDYQLRLVRNGPQLRFAGEYHTSAEPARPARYLETPIYHVENVVSDFERRRSKALRYDAAVPVPDGRGMPIGSFYLPEQALDREPVPVPEEDRAAIAEVVRGTAASTGRARVRASSLPVVSLNESDRGRWPRRDLPDSAYRVEIEPVEHDYRMLAGEHRALHFRVRNTGTETWPWDSELGPALRVSYRWLHPNGKQLTPDGHRTELPHALAPGDATVVPLLVTAPEHAGRFLLEVDMVHEHVRWFECATRFPVAVSAGLGPARRLGPPPPADGFAAGGEIPRRLHRVWLGGGPMPEEHRRFGETWERHHPDWKSTLWTERNLPRALVRDVMTRARNYSEASDVFRFEVLRRHGGVYVDTDVECLRPIDELLEGIDAFAAWEAPGRICGAVIGSVPGHPAFERAFEESLHTIGDGPMPHTTGPPFLTRILQDHPEVRIFREGVFYPFNWDETERRGESFPDAYAIHHWEGSWHAG